MKGVGIPHDRWRPLSVKDVVATFANAPFKWCLAGGYAVEQFLGRSIRQHNDIDVAVYRDDQLRVQRWLKRIDWQLYAADPPGRLRKWAEGEYLPYGIHDVWGHQIGSEMWQIQIMLAEVEGEHWFSRRNPMIRGDRDDLVAIYNGIPCVRIEVQLMYKAKNHRPKDDVDFNACLPQMSQGSRHWLKDKLLLLHPGGHEWLRSLV
jgi:hypothetical protein